ncbi:MAG: GNAT family protein [Thermoproteota archaeon]|nr:GNAT family protein [Thermoproteota archaeon]
MSSYPVEYEKTVTLRDGTEVLLRPELSTDTNMLWEMFSTLSRRSLRFLVRPFTRERVEAWTSNINYEKALPILGVVKEGDKTRIVASATLSFHAEPSLIHKAWLGIAVHDDYQNRGLGAALTRFILEIARKKGLKKVYLRVSRGNKRAVHVYEKCGFKTEAVLKDARFIDGKYCDELYMSIFFRIA